MLVPRIQKKRILWAVQVCTFVCCPALQRAFERRVDEVPHQFCRVAPLRPSSSSLFASVPQVLPRYADVSWEASFQIKIKRTNILLTFNKHLLLCSNEARKDARLSDLSRSQTQSPSSNDEGLHRCQNVSRAMRTAGRLRHCGLQIRK